MSDPLVEISKDLTANVSISTPLLGLEASNGFFKVNEREWTPDITFEASTGLVQEGTLRLIAPGDVSLDDLEDSSARLIFLQSIFHQNLGLVGTGHLAKLHC